MYIAETHSTSSLIREQYMDREDGFFIATDNQTAGRGQQGNHWESEPGKNLTFSVLLHRQWPIAQAWDINIAVALGITDALHDLQFYKFANPNNGDEGLKLAIKWPNDIYIGDKKVCGTLIENFVSGGVIASSIVGIGLNVLQTRFLSDAPNPTSLLLEMQREVQKDQMGQKVQRDQEISKDYLLDRILTCISKRLDEAPEQREQQREAFLAQLYRNNGQNYLWESEGEQFEARIETISPIGELILTKKDGTQQAYHLKQVKHIL